MVSYERIPWDNNQGRFQRRISSEEDENHWTEKRQSVDVLRVGVDEAEADDLFALLQKCLVTEPESYYSPHFYRKGELVIIFPERIFHMTPEKETWQQGNSLRKINWRIRERVGLQT